MRILKDANHIVPYHETHEIWDSTKIRAGQECRRMLFWEYIVGWRLEGRNQLHLIFGEAWHLAMEHLLGSLQKDKRYTDEAISEAYAKFLAKYREHFDASWDNDNAPKNSDNAFKALVEYAHTWSHDDFEVLHTEVGGTVPVSDDRVLHLRMDGVVQDSLGIYDLDHKTSTTETHNFADQFVLGVQLGTYIHALLCMYDAKDIYGAKINAAFFRKSKNGFARYPIRKTPDDIINWMAHVNLWLDMFEQDMEDLVETSISDDVMLAFPMNPTSCTNWGRTCPYFELCMREKNPLRLLESGQPELGFEVDFWDPRSIKDPNKTQVQLERKI